MFLFEQHYRSQELSRGSAKLDKIDTNLTHKQKKLGDSQYFYGYYVQVKTELNLSSNGNARSS